MWHTGMAFPQGLLEGKQPISSSDILISDKPLDGTEYSDAPHTQICPEDWPRVFPETSMIAAPSMEHLRQQRDTQTIQTFQVPMALRQRYNALPSLNRTVRW